MPTLSPPANWPSITRDVYTALQTYRIVGASACTAAIVEALTALATDVAGQPGGGDVYGELAAAGTLFCALKPNTAAYANVVHLLPRGLDTASAPPSELAATVAQRGDAFSENSTASVERIAAMGADLLAARGGVLVHDDSSTILAVLAEAGRWDKDLMVFVMGLVASVISAARAASGPFGYLYGTCGVVTTIITRRAADLVLHIGGALALADGAADQPCDRPAPPIAVPRTVIPAGVTVAPPPRCAYHRDERWPMVRAEGYL